MEDNVRELLSLLSYKKCDYNRCRELIKEIGGATVIILGEDDFQTTPLHETLANEHYDFALELINEPNANLDVGTYDLDPIIWELQYLWTGTKEKQFDESAVKLKLLRSMIKNGANPNPVVERETLLNYLRFKINEEEDETFHLIRMEHIIDAHANGNNAYFFEKIYKTAIKTVYVSKYGFYYADDNLCWSEHTVFEFCDGERIYFASYETDDNNGKFYAVRIPQDMSINFEHYEKITASTGSITPNGSQTRKDGCIELCIDDAILLLTADDNDIEVGITSKIEGAWETQKRKALFNY